MSLNYKNKSELQTYLHLNFKINITNTEAWFVKQYL